MFTRLLVGLDGSPHADSAFEQAVVLAERFRSTLIVAHAREPGATDGGTAMLDRARQRVQAAGLDVRLLEAEGDADTVLAALAKNADAALVGRRGVASRGDEALGATVASLIRTAECCVIVCAGAPSPMRSCAVAFDGHDPSRRALELAARFASIAESTVHIIYAGEDPTAGVQVVGVAEAVLSMQRVAFATHIEAGRPGKVIPAVVKRLHCDALFVGAHLARNGGAGGRGAGGRPSLVVASHAEEILRGTDIPVVIQP